jgi:pimeloyl-ACP methyl ester carboxylesterase
MPEQTYGIIQQAELLTKILGSMDEKCWIVANSIGCNIALYAAQKNPGNIRGFILSGGLLVDSVSASPEAVLPNPDLPIIFQMNITDPEWYRLARACLYKKDSELVYKIVHDFKMTDPWSRFLLSSSVADPEFYFGHRRFLAQTNLPIAIIEGKNDLFINYRYLENLLIPTFWKNKIQFVENAAHYPHQENPADTNVLIDEIISSFK